VGVTAIYVTHDQQEAFAVADRVIIMKQGRIVQQGTPQAVYCQPASPWVAGFLGLTNLFPGRVVSLDPPQVSTSIGPIVPREMEQVEVGQVVTVLIRPEAALLGREGAAQRGIALEGTVRECSFRGGHYRLLIRHETGIDLAFELTSGAASLPQPGDPISLALRPEAISLLEEEVHERNSIC
jgi:ABC-type Fe3+/spermidine/putrescine transport system ATPase subunit